MNEYGIVTDSCHDLPAELVQQLELGVAPLSVQYDENMVFADGDMPPKEFYDGIRGGKMPRTSAVNLQGWQDVMEPVLRQGKDVLALCFAYGLSTTYQSAVIAAQELREQYPQRKILVVDTHCASVGHGLLVYHAAKLHQAGKTLEEVYAWVNEHMLHICHWVTVNDLMHLKRGGRVSAATAMVGTMLQIKPVLIVNEEGKLDTVAKTRGRKAAMKLLVDKLEQTGLPGQNDVVILGHGDCLEDAKEVRQMILDRCNVKQVILSYVGNVIGSHTGPDVLVLAFLGIHR